MSDVSSFPYALWLVPTDEHQRLLTEIVDSLAAKFGTPSFCPHATLCSGTWSSGLSDLKLATDALCRGLEDISLDVNGLGWTDDYFTFFYIKLSDNPHRVFNRASSSLDGAHASNVGPHISLMYSDRVVDIDRLTLSNEIRPALPLQVSFSSVQLVVPATGNWRDIERWEVRHTVTMNDGR